MKNVLLYICLIYSAILAAQNAPPSIVINSWDASSGTSITIKYTLSDPENDPSNIELRAYSKSKNGYIPINTSSATGDIGSNISPGEKEIVWDYIASPGVYAIDIVADDGQIINIQDLVDQVDTNKLKSNLQWLEGTRHKIAGPLHLKETKDSIANLFLYSQLDTVRQEFVFGNYQALNIIGNKYGARNRQRIYINDAHFDSVAGGPGADDNASGVAGFMEIARILSSYTFENSLRFIGFDLEEDGLIGSGAYVKYGLSPYDSIKGVINFEMIGYYSDKNNTQSSPQFFDLVFPAAYAKLVADTFKGNFITNIADYDSKPLSDVFISSAEQYVPQLRVISLSVPDKGKTIPDLRRSDHANFWDKNIQALMLTDGADFRNKAYHTANDISAILNMNFMGNTVKAALATLATLAKPISGDVDGFILDNSVSVNEPIKNQLKLSPNPVKGDLTIDIPENEQGLSINIFDLNGKMIFYKKLNTTDPTYNINVSEWPTSSYVALLKTSKGSYTGKFLKK